MFTNYLAPLDQLFSLSEEIYSELDGLNKPLIVIGGQAVNYWIEYYDLDSNLTDKQRAQASSVDIDLCGSKEDFIAITDKWEVTFRKPPIDQATPEQGICLLVNKVTERIKESDGLLYLDIGELLNTGDIQPNQVDFLSEPNGFKAIDFKNSRLLQHTDELKFPAEFKLNSHPNLKILNPIGCIKSRMSNYYSLKAVRNPELELARINLLRAPLSMFLQESLLTNGFKITQKYLSLAMKLAKSNLGMEIAILHGIDLSLPLSHFVEQQKASLPKEFVSEQFHRWVRGFEKKRERKITCYRKQGRI